MAFADLKNDYIFRRIFTRRPDLLRHLLNDLLDRHGAHAIEALEYLTSEHLPEIAGAKLSILDVRCRERSGTTFVVEMQLLHMAGFLNRIVYNACRAYTNQLRAGDPYTKLADVVAISICDFTLWPDAEQDAAGLPRVPMLSRWNMSERVSGHQGLLQVQYAFLELPKLPPDQPRTPAELWAWLFVHAKKFSEIPADLPSGPHREVVEMANEATFSQGELDAYRKAIDEINQAREYADEKEARGLARGKEEGRLEGRLQGQADAITRVLTRRGLELTPAQQARLATCEDPALLACWLDRAVTASTAAAVFDPAPTA